MPSDKRGHEPPAGLRPRARAAPQARILRGAWDAIDGGSAAPSQVRRSVFISPVPQARTEDLTTAPPPKDGARRVLSERQRALPASPLAQVLRESSLREAPKRFLSTKDDPRLRCASAPAGRGSSDLPGSVIYGQTTRLTPLSGRQRRQERFRSFLVVSPRLWITQARRGNVREFHPVDSPLVHPVDARAHHLRIGVARGWSATQRE